VTWETEPGQSGPDGPPADVGAALSDGPAQARPDGRRRGGRRLAAFTVLLAAGLVGLAVSAVGVAHNLLPREFTVAQRRQIAAWELNRRWRALPAAAIFPDSVSYTVPGSDLNSSRNLTLQARLLSISPDSSCAAAMSGPAAQTLSQHGCTAAMRATYVDASGSLVATVIVAVLPTTAAQRAVVEDLTGAGTVSPALVQALPVAGTAASVFADPQRQLTTAVGAGPYVILSTAGFADGRHHVRLAADPYLDSEMSSLTSGLVSSAERPLDQPLPPLVCPGAPGC
jgi:hypothetical protein